MLTDAKLNWTQELNFLQTKKKKLQFVVILKYQLYDIYLDLPV